VANLPASIAERELAVVRAATLPGPGEFVVDQDQQGAGPGNAVAIALRFASITEVVGALGARGRPAEAVARAALAQAAAYLRHEAAVGEHLADQLLVPMALAGGGTFRTCEPSSHTRTNAAVIERLLPVRIEFVAEAGGTCRVAVVRSPA
jgi:RNA 3'-terminal phosphate cyclase (ATP)